MGHNISRSSFLRYTTLAGAGFLSSSALRPILPSTFLPSGRMLPADLVPDLLDCIVYINLPIFKDHQRIRFIGALKNLLGVVADRSNQTFHQGSDPFGDRDKYAYLSQSIADAELLRTPALSIGDGTEILVQGGTFGPGLVRIFRTVVASTDPAALDACGAAEGTTHHVPGHGRRVGPRGQRGGVRGDLQQLPTPA